MNWTTLNAILLNLAVTNNLDANFQTELPDIINYAENRIYRDLDFLETRISQAGPALVPGSRNVSMSALTYPIIVLERMNIITPVGGTTSSGTRNPLTRQAMAYMDMMYPTNGTVPAAVTIPVDYAMVDQQSVVVGPPPDAAYGTEFFGTYRPAQVSASNPTTWLLTNLPDLYVAACMIRIAGYQKNYAGAASDDPMQATSWENQYMKLLDGAAVEEARRKAQSASWSDQKALPQSTPQRT